MIIINLRSIFVKKLIEKKNKTSLNINNFNKYSFLYLDLILWSWFKRKIKEIKTLVETKFISLYDIKYLNKNNQEKSWTVASRKSKDIL